MAAVKNKPEAHDTASVPTAGARPIIGNDPPMPVAPRAIQEESFFTLRRFRKALKQYPPAVREWIALSLLADVEEDRQQANGQIQADIGADQPI